MSDYTGKERRQGEAYITAEEWAEVKRDVKATREKVFNGLSGIPKILMWGFGIIISLLVAALTVVGSVRVQTATLKVQLENHIGWGEIEQAENQAVIDALLEKSNEN